MFYRGLLLLYTSISSMVQDWISYGDVCNLDEIQQIHWKQSSWSTYKVSKAVKFRALNFQTPSSLDFVQYCCLVFEWYWWINVLGNDRGVHDKKSCGVWKSNVCGTARTWKDMIPWDIPGSSTKWVLVPFCTWKIWLVRVFETKSLHLPGNWP